MRGGGVLKNVTKWHRGLEGGPKWSKNLTVIAVTKTFLGFTAYNKTK
jgi:hypothetical protein